MKPKDKAPELSGHPMTGRIVRILHGQGHGYVRTTDRREVFFHRGDTGGTFNDLQPGDLVTFEVLEDRVSGARALRVRKQGSR